MKMTKRDILSRRLLSQNYPGYLLNWLEPVLFAFDTYIYKVFIQTVRQQFQFEIRITYMNMKNLTGQHPVCARVTNIQIRSYHLHCNAMTLI